MKNSNRILVSIALATVLLGTSVFAGYKLSNGSTSLSPLTDVLAADTADDTDLGDINLDDIIDECPPELCGDEIDTGEEEKKEVPENVDNENPENNENVNNEDQKPPVVEKAKCVKEDWECKSWAECPKEGATTRACELKEGVDCETKNGYKPAETASCTPPAPKCDADKWSCGAFGACAASGLQTRQCTMTFDCEEADTPKPFEKQNCMPPKKIEPQVTPQNTVKEPVEKTVTEEQPSDVRENETQENKEGENVENKNVEDSNKEDKNAEKQVSTEEKAMAEVEKFLAEDTTLTEEEKKEQEVAVQAATKEVTAQAEEAIKEKLQEAEQTQQALTVAIADSPAFQELLGDELIEIIEPEITDVNGNGIPDKVEADAGVDPNAVDTELVRLTAELKVQEKKLIEEGDKSEKEVKVLVEKVLQKKKTEKKIAMVRAMAEKKFNVKIKNSKQDSNGDGISDETEIILGLDPKEKPVKGEKFSSAEKKIYGIKAKKEDLKSKCTMSVNNGSKLSTSGFTILAACPANKVFDLIAVDKKGRKYTIDTKVSSENNKIIFAINRKMSKGKYIFQIKPSAKVSYFDSDNWHASVLNETSDTQPSDAVIVEVDDKKEIVSPVVQNIENIEVAGLHDIKVKSTADGKIRVTGLSDITTMVVGTFSSAVFTSAILADVTTGSFEVASSSSLANGDHEVVVYATRPEEGLQSAPIKIKFNVVPTAKAASGSANKGFPIIPVAVGVGALILIGIGVTLLKKKKTSQN